MCFVSWKFDRSLNTVCSVLLLQEAIKQRIFFSFVHSFAKNLCFADFELYVNPGDANTQHLFKLSGIGQKQCTSSGIMACIERPRFMRSVKTLSSNNPAVRCDNNRDCFDEAYGT